MQSRGDFALSCPIPIENYPRVLLAHGGGGRLTHQLIERMFLPAFGEDAHGAKHDGAILQANGAKLAFTTDSYVVQPLFFPGGDIGSLAVHGTVNDLAMCGARPLWLSVGFILEEGLEMEALWRITRSMASAAQDAGARIVTGDTKVVERGSGDGAFITMTGVGAIEHELDIAPRSISPGDAVLLSGDLGRHGIALMAKREGLEFETQIQSDSAPLHRIAQDLWESGLSIHCLRDLTRGGLGGALVELAEAAGVGIRIDEASIPVGEDVAGACEILGLDPLYVANEGRFIVFLPESQADAGLEILRGHPDAGAACKIGNVTKDANALATMTSLIGAERVLDMPSGEQLPRIC